MRILQICKKVPWPLTDGESIAVNALSIEYSKSGLHVDLLCKNTSKQYRDISEVRSNLTHYQNVITIDVNNRASIGLIITNLFRQEPIQISRLRSADFEKNLIECLFQNSYDIIQLETAYPAMYLPIIRQHSDAKVVIRAHNVEHLIWKRLASNSSLFRKLYYGMQSRRIKSFEESVIQKVDMLVTLSEVDQKELSGCKLTYVAPIGLDMSKYVIRRKSSKDKSIKLGFIGTLDWKPNEQGLLWFLKEVLPEFSGGEEETVSLHIAGRKISTAILKYESDQTIIEGEVPDAREFIFECDAMIVPLFAGSGQRVKILEAMALGKVVISTTIGIEGIEAAEGFHYLLADSSTEFIKQIKKLQSDDEVLNSNTIRGFVHENHNQNSIGLAIIEKYRALLKEKY